MPSVSISVWTPRSRTPLSQQQRADGVGHAADADLQAGAVFDFGGDQVGNGAVDVGWLRDWAVPAAAGCRLR